MGQAAFHLLDKVLKGKKNLLCLSEVPLRQKPMLKPSEVDNRHSVHL
jgi:hypothetical protein